MPYGSDPSDKETIAARIEQSDARTDNRYISVADGEKVCYGDHTDPANRFDSPPHGNYGVYLTAADRLVVLDVDDYDGGDDLPFTLPETLVEESPHGGKHLYYHVPVDEDGRMPAAVFDDEIGAKNPVPSWGEVQVSNKYVVAAGSALDKCGKDWHDCSQPGEGAYTVKEDRAIATVEADRLVEVLLEDDDIERATSNFNSGGDDADGADDVDVDVHDVLFSAEYPEGKRCEHPVHGSSTGANFKVDDDAETWRCWRHGCTGNALHLIGMQNDIIDCGDWDNGGLTTETWREIFEAAREDGYDVGKEITSSQPSEPEYEDVDDNVELVDLASEAVQRVFEKLNPPEEAEHDPISKQQAIHEFAVVIDTYWHWLYPDATANGWVNELYVYDPRRGIYAAEGQALAESVCEDLLGSFSDNHVVAEITSKLKRRNRVPAHEIDQQQPPKDELVVGNGILNLRTGELRDYTPEEYHSIRIDVDYNPDAECPRIDEFFHSVVKPEHVPTLYRLAAHMLVKDYPAQKAAAFVGEGSNGKGTVLDLFHQFVGRRNTVSRGLQRLVDYPFAAKDLHCKMANLEGDLSPNELDDSRMFKKLTGDDRITGDLKHANENIEFENHATLVFALNSVPEAPEDTHGWWRRWIYIPFPHQFSDDEKVPRSKLMAGLTSDDELEGLLARCVREIQRYYETDEFFPDVQSPEEVREQMMNAANPIRDFVTTAFTEVEDPEGDYGKVVKNRVVDAYDRYAAENDLPRQNAKKLKEEIQNLDDYSISSAQSRAVTPGNSRDRVFAGIEWTSRGRQLAGIDEPGDDEQETIDEAETDDEKGKLAEDVWLRDIREYVEQNPDADVYAVMREFELGGDAFDAVEAVIEAVNREESEGDEDDDDDDEGGSGVTTRGDNSDGGDGGEDKGSVDGSGGTDDPDASIPSEIHGVSRAEIREYIEENDATAEDVKDEYWMPSEEMEYVRRAIARWGDADAFEGERSDDTGDERQWREGAVVDDPSKTVAWYDDVNAGSSDVDVVVVPESEYAPGMELSYGDVEFHSPGGDRL